MNDAVMNSVLLGACRVVRSVQVLDPVYVVFVCVIDSHFTADLRPIADSHESEQIKLEKMVPVRPFGALHLLPPPMGENQDCCRPNADHLADNRLRCNLLVILVLYKVHHKVIQVT
jgi:hypothetical protein